MKPTVLLNSCKTRPQPWQGALQWAEQSNRTRTFVPGFYLRWSLNVSVLCVHADGDLCSGYGSSWPRWLPIRSGFIWQCFNRGCSLYAPWHGHWNSKYVFTVHSDRSAVVYVFIIPTPIIQSLRAHLHKQMVLQTYCSVNVYFTISAVSHNLHKPTVLHATSQEQFI